MSHEVENMFAVGERAWHGLGVHLQDSPAFADALQIAGLDWRVSRMRLAVQASGAEVDAFATVRETDGAILGVVGPDYRVIQQAEAFAHWEPWIASGDVKLEAAGSLRGGRHVWILGRINRDPVDVVAGDRVEPYVLFTNSHDGSRVARVGFTATRVVCQNTLTAAIGSSRLLRIRHTKNADLAIKGAHSAIDIAHRQFVATMEEMRILAQHGCNVSDLRKLVHRVFRAKDADVLESPSETALKSDRLFDAIEPLFLRGRGNKGETYWDALNAITEYLTWERGSSQDVRLQSLWMGDASKLAEKAAAEALAACLPA